MQLGEGLDRRAGFFGDLRDPPILGLDIGLGKQVCTARWNVWPCFDPRNAG
jgi:hypothetical protein